MSNQLIKTTKLGKENVFPRTRILDLFDKTSGLKLIDILRSFNMMFVPYLGNKSYTRNQISPELRRQGLWLTYVIDNTVYTEWYDEVAIDDTNWGSDSNWRQGSNALVGDLSISPNGTWVINGEDSGITIKGDKGDSPVIRIYDNKILVSYDKGVTYEDLNNTPVYTKFRFNSLTNTYLVSYDLGGTWQDISNEKVYHKFRYNSTTNTYLESIDFGKTWSNISAEKVYYQFRYNEETNTHLVSTDLGLNWTDVSSNKVYYLFRTNDNRLLVSTDLGTTWENCSEPIAAWFRWADTSGTGNIGKVLISRDLLNWEDLSPVITNNLYIKGYVSTVGELPTSSAAIGDIYMVGPTYDESDTSHDYPHYRMWVKLSSGWTDNGEYLSNVLVTLDIINNTSTGNVPSTLAVRNYTNTNGVINISTNYNSNSETNILTLSLAITKVPLKDRVLGFQIKFLSSEGWKLYTFIGESISLWSDITKWEELLQTSSIAQELGTSNIKPISQAAITNITTSINSKLDDSIFPLYFVVDDLSSGSGIVQDITDILPAGSKIRAKLVDTNLEEIQRIFIENLVNDNWVWVCTLEPNKEILATIDAGATEVRFRNNNAETNVKKSYKIEISKLSNTLNSYILNAESHILNVESNVADLKDLDNREAVYTDLIPINKYIKELYTYNLEEGAYLRLIRNENNILLITACVANEQPYLEYYNTLDYIKSNPIIGLVNIDKSSDSGVYMILNVDNIPANTEYVFRANFKSMANNINYSPTIKKMYDNSFLQGITSDVYLNYFIKGLYLFDDFTNSSDIALTLVNKPAHYIEINNNYVVYAPKSNIPYKLHTTTDYATVVGYIILDWDAIPDEYINNSINIKLKDYNNRIKNQYITNFLQLKENLPESIYFSQDLYNEHPQTIEKLSDTEYTLYNVSNEEELRSAIQNDNSLISFSNDISISTPIYLESKNHIVIEGNGYNIVQKGNELSSTGKIIGKLKEFEFFGGFNGSNRLMTDKGNVLYLSETDDYIAESEFIKVDGYEDKYKLKYPSNITLDIKESDNVYIRVTAWFVSMYVKVIESTSDGYLVVQYRGLYSINGDYEFAKKYCTFKLINYTVNNHSFVYKNNKIYAPIRYNKLYNISLDNIFNITLCNNILFRNIKFKGSNNSNKFVIEVTSSDNIYVNCCDFYNLSRAINSNEGSSVYCHNSNFKDIEFESVSALDGYIEVQKCYFENCNTAKLNTFCVASKGDYYIADNTMVNFGYGGISVGIIAVSSDFNASGIVENNHLYYTEDYYNKAVYNVQMDSGAIYVATNNKNCIIRNNIIHDITGRGANRGIFVDDGGYNVSIVSNLIYRIQNSFCIDSRFAEGRPTNGNPVSCNNTILYNIFSGSIRFEGNIKVENNNCKSGYNLSIQNFDSYLSRDIVQYLHGEDIIYDYSTFVKNNHIISSYLDSLRDLWKIHKDLLN